MSCDTVDGGEVDDRNAQQKHLWAEVDDPAWYIVADVNDGKPCTAHWRVYCDEQCARPVTSRSVVEAASSPTDRGSLSHRPGKGLIPNGGGGDECRKRKHAGARGWAEDRRHVRMMRPGGKCAWSPFDIIAAIKVRGKDAPNAETEEERHRNPRSRRCGNAVTVNVCDNVDAAGEDESDCRHFGFPLAPRLCGNADIADDARALEGGEGGQLQRGGPVGVGIGLYIAPNVYIPSGCKCRKEGCGGGCRKEMEGKGEMEMDACRVRCLRYLAHRNKRNERRTHTHMMSWHVLTKLWMRTLAVVPQSSV